jgi:hypothetical protein
MLVLAIFLIAAAGAADPKEGGWRPLFDGTDLAAWTSAAGQQPSKGWVVEDGTLVRKEPAGDLWTGVRFGDFVLDLEFQTTGNSGVFIRTDKPTDNVPSWADGRHARPGRAEGGLLGVPPDGAARQGAARSRLRKHVADRTCPTPSSR